MASESESERRETSADIADEIRRAVESMGDEMPYTVSAGTMRKVADRIEAAAKRVVVSKTETTIVGNAAALRETLVWMKDRMNAAIHDGSFECYEALEKINAALSAPPRNCDVGTADEQAKRFEEFCNSHTCTTEDCKVHKSWSHFFAIAVLKKFPAA